LHLLRGKKRRKHHLRHFALSIGDEEVLAERDPRVLWSELQEKLRSFTEISQDDFRKHPDFRRANSLLWVWVHMKRDMVRTNIQILLTQRGIRRIPDLARLMGHHQAYIRFMLAMEKPVGMGAWSLPNLFRLASCLKVSPEKLLSVDLREVIDRSLAR
jgi:hypothetical protein